MQPQHGEALLQPVAAIRPLARGHVVTLMNDDPPAMSGFGPQPPQLRVEPKAGIPLLSRTGTAIENGSNQLLHHESVTQ